MPKINVYLPDDLAESVRDTGVPVSAICQRALEQAVRRVAAIREAVLTDLDRDTLAERLPQFTPRLATVLGLAADRAESSVTTGDLLAGMLGEGENLALQVLSAMDVAPSSLVAPSTSEPSAPGSAGMRFSRSAAVALELAVGEAVGFGHNYVGCEHLLIGLAAETDGAAGALLRERGADAKASRRAVAAALAGYVHLTSTIGAGGRAEAGMTQVLTAVRAELAPLVARIERLEGMAPGGGGQSG